MAKLTKRKKQRIIKELVIAIVAIAAFLLSQYGIDLNKSKPKEVDGTMQVHYLDVGQGDATLVTCDGAAMLIDAGNNNKGTEVKEYLESQNIQSLDLVIGTHGDADHIGGLDIVIDSFDCGTIIMPDRKRDTKTYKDVITAVENKNYVITYPMVGNVYDLGEAEVKVIAPVDNKYGSNENNYSVGVLVTYGESIFLFTGDAEEEAEEDILSTGIDIDCDVYKAAHHGSSTANTSAFLDAALPEYVVISCGEGNDYGHPHSEVLNELRTRGIKVFRTDEQGAIVASTDGKSITFNMSPDESWRSGSGARVN